MTGDTAAAATVSQRDLVRQSERSEKALRCTVLKNILGEADVEDDDLVAVQLFEFGFQPQVAFGG